MSTNATSTEQLVDLIAENDLDEAFSLLDAWSINQRLQRALILLRNEYAQLEEDRRKNMLTRNDRVDAYKELSSKLLEWAAEYEEQYNGTDNPSLPSTRRLHAFGQQLLQAGDHHRAILYFSRVLLHQPDHVAALLDRGTAKAALHAFEEAFPDLERATRLDPEQPFAWLNRGHCAYRLGRVEEACRSWRRVQALGFDLADQNLAMLCDKESPA